MSRTTPDVNRPITKRQAKVDEISAEIAALELVDPENRRIEELRLKLDKLLG